MHLVFHHHIPQEIFSSSVNLFSPHFQPLIFEGNKVNAEKGESSCFHFEMVMEQWYQWWEWMECKLSYLTQI